MKNSCLFKSIKTFLLLFLLSGLSLQASDIKQLQRDVSKEIRMSEKMMYKKDMDAAKGHMDKAKDMINSIKEQDPKNRSIKKLQMKYNRHQKTLDRKMKKTSSSSSSKRSSTSNTTTKTATNSKLPGGVKHRLKKIDKFLDEVDGGSSYRLEEIDRLMDEISKNYGGKFSPDHPDFKSVTDRISSAKSGVETGAKQKAEAKQEAQGKQAAVKELSKRWTLKMRPYIATYTEVGNDEAKYLTKFSSKSLYDEAMGVYKQYLKIDFVDTPTFEVKDTARKLKYSLDSFEESRAQQQKNIEKTIDDKISFFNTRIKDRVAKDDGKTAPLPLQKDMIPEIQNLITKAEKKGIDKAKVLSWKQNISSLQKQNNKLIKLKIERTLMTPDQFGNDQEALDLKAQAVIFMKNNCQTRGNYSKVKALRTTIIKDRWDEERVWEYTDSTKTQRRHRTTRSIRAQVAGKEDGTVYLYWVNMSKDLQSGGKWGPLKGHVMYRDEMLEKNVNK